jgi:hypothetical protein
MQQQQQQQKIVHYAKSYTCISESLNETDKEFHYSFQQTLRLQTFISTVVPFGIQYFFLSLLLPSVFYRFTSHQKKNCRNDCLKCIYNMKKIAFHIYMQMNCKLTREIFFRAVFSAAAAVHGRLNLRARNESEK